MSKAVFGSLVKDDDHIYDPRTGKWFDLPVLAEAARGKNLALVLVFGSHAKGLTHEESDLDLAVWPGERADKSEFELSSEMIRAIEPACKFDLDRLDVILIPTVNSTLFMEIFRNHIVVYARSERDYVNFTLKAMNDYEDDWLYRKLRDRVVADWLDEVTTQ